MPTPIFSLTRNALPLSDVLLDGEPSSDNRTALGELQVCGFELSSREADTEYALSIGDLEPRSQGRGSANADPALGRAAGPKVYWDDAPYFESARGIVVVWLRSRAVASGGAWQLRAALQVVIVPSKLGEARYLAMFEQLRSLAAGLLFDLLSKTLRDLDYVARGDARPSHRSSQLELRAIERTWTDVAQGLHGIEKEPVLRLTRRPRFRLSWGTHPLRADTIAHLVSSGVDVRSPYAVRPIPLVQDVLEESPDTIEHRIILGFIVLLARRVRECGRNAAVQVSMLEEQRPLRDIAIEAGPTLFEMYDRPRIERLQGAVELADDLLICLRRAAALPFLHGLRPSFIAPETPVFVHVAPYHQMRAAMSSYLHSSIVILEAGSTDRLKSTSRLYEHWVFFQLVAAFRRAGLECEDVGEMLKRLGHERFTLDLDERTRVILRAPSGERLIIRYEPWVLPREAARKSQETIYGGRSGTAAWRPDVIIEFPASGGSVPELATAYAVVVDAKYSKEVREEHWARAEKYAEIRAVRDDRQVVRQVWLAYPGSGGITCRDTAVTWTPRGPDRPIDETIFGTLAMMPPEVLPGADGGTDGEEPVEAAQIFANGLLKYLGLL